MSVTELFDIATLADARQAALSGHARELRLGAGLSQAEIATYCGVTPTAVALWETGQRRPRGEAAHRYARLIRLLKERD